jgi:hypothetical protein
MTADYWRVCQALNLLLNAHFYRTCCDGDHTPKITLGLGTRRWEVSRAHQATAPKAEMDIGWTPSSGLFLNYLISRTFLSHG